MLKVISCGSIFIIAITLIAGIPYHAFSQSTLYFDNSIKVYDENSQLSDPWSGGINAGQFGMIDFTGDGIKDLVVYDRTSNLVNLFRYDSGSFLYSPEYNYLFPDDLYGYVVIRDYNHDGLPDIFTSGKRGMKAYRNISMKGEPLQFEVAADPVLSLTNSGRINLQVNYTDIPAIDDIDGDGDLDILVYNFALGKSIRYHKNLSIEKFGNADSLDFQLEDQEWGQFEECDCHQFAFTTLGQTCDIFTNQRAMHIGGKSMLLIDMNNDGLMDLLLGHENCNEIYFLPNSGTSEKALMTTYSENFPDTIDPANFPVFPAAFYEDIDKDGTKDLIVSSNDQSNVLKSIDYKNSVWYYKNSGFNDLPFFQLNKKNFLQGNMIDVGENAKPLLIDIDKDGDLDLLVAGNGFPVNGVYYGYVTLFKNNGNSEYPEFNLENPDFLSLSSLHLFDLFISSADFNSDDIPDYFISGINPVDYTITSVIVYVTSKPGQPIQFYMSKPGDVNIPLDINDTPCFTDVDNDGHVDALVGTGTGRLDYYRNVGVNSSPVFVLKENDYLGIKDSFFEFRKNLVPFSIDFDLDGNKDLLTTNYLGEITIYRNYKNNVKSEPLKFYNPLINSDEDRKQGIHTWITAGNLYDGKYPVIIFGNIQGGLTLYRQELPGNSEDENKLVLNVFPNPLHDQSIINIKSNQNGQATIYSILGQSVSSGIQITANRARQVEMANAPQGIYILKMKDLHGRTASRRIIINH